MLCVHQGRHEFGWNDESVLSDGRAGEAGAPNSSGAHPERESSGRCFSPRRGRRSGSTSWESPIFPCRGLARRCIVLGGRASRSPSPSTTPSPWSGRIGLELGISVASAVLRNEPTGAPTGFRGDVVAVAKRDLVPGELLDGEGGYTVYGRLMRAEDSLVLGGLPMGLTQDATMTRPVAAGQTVRWSDVDMDTGRQVVHIRREMEAALVVP